MILRLYLILFLVLLFSNYSICQTNEHIGLLARIDSIINHHMQANSIVGLSIGIVKDGELYLTKGYGSAEVNTQKPVNEICNCIGLKTVYGYCGNAIGRIGKNRYYKKACRIFT